MNQDNGGIIGKVNTPTTSLASGVWSLDSQFDSQASSIWPLAFPQTTIANSCRFNDGSADNLSRTTWATPTSTKIFTMSVWVKRTTLGATQQIVNSYVGSGNDNQLKFKNTDAIELTVSTSGTEYFLKTNRVFRDTNAWYHIVFAFDSTQATDSNRYKLYVNGTQETSFSSVSYPPQDTTYQFFNNSNANRIGIAWGGSVEDFDGYMAEFVFVDGQQLTPTSFGESNSDGVWVPVAPPSSLGTNGFHLDFEDSSSLGNDAAGSNNFTVNNLTSADQTTDTPLNNYSTLNPLLEVTNPTLSEGNLKFAGTGAVNFAGASIPVSDGKWYVEVKATTVSGSYPIIGVIDSQSTMRKDGTYFVGSDASTDNPSGFAVFSNGDIYHNNSNSYGNLTTTYTNGDIIGMALDMDASPNTLAFYKNGALETTINLDTPPSGFYMFATGIHSSTSGAVGEFNFGNPTFTISSTNADANGYGSFEYTVPSGYFALNTKNLAQYG